MTVQSTEATNMDANKLVNFMYYCNKLKFELRHCWFEGERRESVADHSWQLALLAVSVAPRLSVRVDLLKLVKMLLIHDIVEIEAGDTPLIERETNSQLSKTKREEKAIESIRTMLSNELGCEIYDLWYEYEALETLEAKVAKALDRLEAFMAHNVSDIASFSKKELQMYNDPKWIINPCSIDQFLSEIAEIVTQDGLKKVGDLKNT